jgi:hypothetical protein
MVCPEARQSSAVASGRKGRYAVLGCVAVCFSALYYRSLSWGWLGFDDRLLLTRNPHLGHGFSSFVWGFCDIEFGRRWTPVLWTVANSVGVPSALKFHVLVFFLGLALCLLVAWCYLDFLTPRWALCAALLFTASPLRLEVFTWGMGFVYETTAILLCLAFVARRHPARACSLVALALLCYPQAAGAALIAIWCFRKSWPSFALSALLVVLVVIQMTARVHHGFIPWHMRWDLVPLVPANYAFELFWPFATVPIFPPVFYWPMLAGVLVIGVTGALAPRALVIWCVLLAPTVLASVTESFWFGARYALIPEIPAYCFLIYLVSRDTGRYRGWLVAVVLMAFAGRNLGDYTLSKGIFTAASGAAKEARSVGLDFDLWRYIKGYPGIAGTVRRVR